MSHSKGNSKVGTGYSLIIMGKDNTKRESKEVTLPKAPVTSIDEKRTTARNTLFGQLSKTALTEKILAPLLDGILSEAINAEEKKNEAYSKVGLRIFGLRREFLTAKLTTWSAFLNGTVPYEECGFQAVTRISRSSALRYLAIYNKMQGLPQTVKDTPFLVDAIETKLGDSFKAVQYGHLAAFLSTDEGKQAVKDAKLESSEDAAKLVNTLLKDLREERTERTEKTTSDMLREALNRIYLKDGSGKAKKEPDVTKPRERVGYLLGLARMIEDIGHLQGSISSLNKYGVKITVSSGSLEKTIETLSAVPIKK